MHNAPGSYLRPVSREDVDQVARWQEDEEVASQWWRPRKDLWHRGYGTATVVVLLEKVFNSYGLERAWVNIPENNSAALGLVQEAGLRSLGDRRALQALGWDHPQSPRSRHGGQ